MKQVRKGYVITDRKMEMILDHLAPEGYPAFSDTEAHIFDSKEAAEKVLSSLGLEGYRIRTVQIKSMD